MNKKTLIIIAVCVVLFIAYSFYTGIVSIDGLKAAIKTPYVLDTDKVLQVGTGNAAEPSTEVKELQRILNVHALPSPPLLVDGIFGNLTQQALSNATHGSNQAVTLKQIKDFYGIK
jgi:hypothetical protein